MKSMVISALLLVSASLSMAGNWQAEATLSGVEVSYKTEQCNGLEVVILKITNTNNYAVSLQWANELELAGAPTALRSDWAGDGTGIYTVTLAAGQSMEGSCAAGVLTVDPSTLSSMPPLPVNDYNMVDATVQMQ